MSYTIQSAAYADPENDAVLAQTQEAGAVVITQQRAALWSALQAWVAGGGVIAAHQPPDPNILRDHQRSLAKAWLRGVEPASRAGRTIVLTLMDELNRFRAQTVAAFLTPSINPNNLANNAGQTILVDVPAGQGPVAFRDEVAVAAPYTLNGVQATGYVDSVSPQRVAILLHNSSGASRDLVAGQWGVVVRRPALLPQLQVGDVLDALDAHVDNGETD